MGPNLGRETFWERKLHCMRAQQKQMIVLWPFIRHVYHRNTDKNRSFKTLDSSFVSKHFETFLKRFFTCIRKQNTQLPWFSRLLAAESNGNLNEPPIVFNGQYLTSRFVTIAGAKDLFRRKDAVHNEFDELNPNKSNFLQNEQVLAETCQSNAFHCWTNLPIWLMHVNRFVDDFFCQ